ncbi:MAG TPA: hypothetical protein VFT47_20760 [Vicinamibacterales bacterium]|nr:hypothetical protein [Vicinamibacterales bacterium]
MSTPPAAASPAETPERLAFYEGLKPASFVVDELLVHHVAKHQGQIRRSVAQFSESGLT